MPPTPSCLNCGAALDGAFCARCGQRADRGRLSMRESFGDALSHWFNLDSAVARTVRGLTVNPGGLVREYVEGKRARYVNPLKYCFTVLALYLLANALFGIDPSEVMRYPEEGQSQEMVAAVDELRRQVTTHLNIIVFLALPFWAMALRLLYRRSGYNLAESYAFGLYVTGHAYLLGVVLVPLALLHPQLAITGRLLFRLGFFAYAAHGFYREPLAVGLLKALLAVVAFVATVGLMVLGFLLPLLWWMRG